MDCNREVVETMRVGMSIFEDHQNSESVTGGYVPQLLAGCRGVYALISGRNNWSISSTWG